MGPFKHTVDDGLDLRKAAFECMYTLLETCLARLDIFEFLSQVENGLRDHYDIKVGVVCVIMGRGITSDIFYNYIHSNVLHILNWIFRKTKQATVLIFAVQPRDI